MRIHVNYTHIKSPVKALIANDVDPQNALVRQFLLPFFLAQTTPKI